jgi:glycosyltransferase involved in cell wall biosynthesis
VLVIDDGSTDSSAQIAIDAGGTVLKTAGRAGYDGAIEYGLQAAYDQGFDFVVTIDADGEHDPKLTAKFVEAYLKGAALVIGIRPKPQRLAEWVVCGYCSYRFGIKDILCGMKGFTRVVLEGYFADPNPNLLNTWAALLWAANKENSFQQIDVTGVPRQDQPRFQSTLRANIRIASMLGSIRRLAKTG